ncbi:MAG: hypothetical protein AB1705_11555 [Verrucomicrobiota bacterium]
MVREGLGRLDGVESVEERADAAAGTGSLRIKDVSLLDPAVMAQTIFDIRIGARLRGMEATIEGKLKREKDTLTLHFTHGGADQVVTLAPLQKKIQLGAQRTGVAPPTKDEREAFTRLQTGGKNVPSTIRVTGPVTRPKSDAPLTLEVRHFEPVR